MCIRDSFDISSEYNFDVDDDEDDEADVDDVERTETSELMSGTSQLDEMTYGDCISQQQQQQQSLAHCFITDKHQVQTRSSWVSYGCV